MERFYKSGSVLELKVIGTGPQSPPLFKHSQSIKVQIIDVIEPITLSVVLRVRLIDDEVVDVLGGPSTIILKLYDHRFPTGLREGNFRYDAIPPWDPTTEDEFLDLIWGDRVQEFGSTYDQDEDKVPFDEKWNAAEKEAFLYTRCLRLYNCETTAYHALEALQGVDIPALYTNVQLQAGPVRVGPDGQSLQVNGLLLEEVKGFSLRDVAAHAPELSWSDICEQAIAIIHKIDECEIINEDVRIDNVLVRKSPTNQEADEQSFTYKAVLIDFALAWVRSALQPQPTDREWTIWKCSVDEEGGLGYMMQAKLQKRVGSRKKKVEVFPFTYCPSNRYTRLGDDTCIGPLGSFSGSPRA